MTTKLKNGKNAVSDEPIHWTSPTHIIQAILRAFEVERFCLDTASPNPPSVPCRRFYSEEMDGLSQPWHGHLVFLNPPFVRLQTWIKKAIHEYKIERATKMVLLLPARFETAGMRALCDAGAAMFLLTHRLRFGNANNAAPWASAVYVLGGTDAELDRLMILLPDHQRIQLENGPKRAKMPPNRIMAAE